jgi:aminoglycoside phosphotransferase family enzyme/predicted kinase
VERVNDRAGPPLDDRPDDDRLVADLCLPENFPPPRPDRVELRSTHISWVFLAGDTAWKVKRPVDLGFLDFRTPAQREHFCREELRLNRRLAPGVYQEVVPVWRTGAGYTLDAPAAGGVIADHAVKMRRLPDDRSAAALLRAGALGPERLAELAARLAAFHAGADRADDLAAPEVLAANVEENLTQLAAFAGDPLDAGRLAQVAEAQRRDLGRHHGRLLARQEAGKIRDGHGDLRLEHVYFVDQPLVIDCLEFARRFRCADVALDVAFLVMELRAAGRAELAEYLIHRFARDTNDYELYPLLDFYCAYRALVRAKVACLLAADPAVAADKRRRKSAEAQDLLALTAALEQGSPRRPAVIAIGGLVGSGKSTLADGLAAARGIPAISSDLARKWLAGLAPHQPGGPEIYSRSFGERTYGELIRRAGLVLDGGRSVVLDASFHTPAQRRLARDLAAARDATVLFVETGCDEATLRGRLRVRASAGSESDADERVLDVMRAESVPPDEIPAGQRLRVDGSRPLPALVAEVSARLSDPGAAR